MLGLFYTLFSGSAEGKGLASGGILVFNALVGFTVGALIGVLMIVKMEHKSTVIANKIVTIVNLVFIIIIMFIIKSKV